MKSLLRTKNRSPNLEQMLRIIIFHSKLEKESRSYTHPILYYSTTAKHKLILTYFEDQ